MEKAELLQTFHRHLDNYANYRSFINKAQEQAGKFSSATISRVIEKNESKSVEEADLIRPLVPQLEDLVLELTTEIDQIKDRKASADVEMEELELRKVIGEISDEDFEVESASFRQQLDAAESRISGLAGELKGFQDALDRWVELAVAAGHPTGLSQDSAPEPEPQLESAPAPEIATQGAAATSTSAQELAYDDPVWDNDPAEAEAEEPVLERPDSTQSSLRDDVSALFQDAPMEDEADAGEEELSIEVAEAVSGEQDAGDGLEIGFDVEENDGDIDLLSEDNDVELDLVGGEQQAEDDLGFGAEEPAQQAAAAASTGQRRAYLIYQEGTAEEQIYPFNADQITVGRGRDNDIQIKNDSKVSRYHCKLYHRAGNYYIEDNKSSNGSLVNGELITERRLFGGEEVIIGETFFRFRIME